MPQSFLSSDFFAKASPENFLLFEVEIMCLRIVNQERSFAEKMTITADFIIIDSIELLWKSFGLDFHALLAIFVVS